MKVATEDEFKLIEAELQAFKEVNPIYAKMLYIYFAYQKAQEIPCRYVCLLFQGFESRKASQIEHEDKVYLKSIISDLKQVDYTATQHFINILQRHRLKGYENIINILLNLYHWDYKANPLTKEEFFLSYTPIGK